MRISVWKMSVLEQRSISRFIKSLTQIDNNFTKYCMVLHDPTPMWLLCNKS